MKTLSCGEDEIIQRGGGNGSGGKESHDRRGGCVNG